MVSDVIEGDNAGLIVQENPNLAWRDLKVEGSLDAGASLIFLFVPQPNCPEARLRAERKLPLPLHRVSTNTQVPGLLPCHIYLPVNLSRVKALGTQDHGIMVKSVLIFRHFLPSVSKPYLSPILWKDEPWIGCVWIQSDVYCRERTTVRQGEGGESGTLGLWCEVRMRGEHGLTAGGNTPQPDFRRNHLSVPASPYPDWLSLPDPGTHSAPLTPPVFPSPTFLVLASPPHVLSILFNPGTRHTFLRSGEVMFSSFRFQDSLLGKQL